MRHLLLTTIAAVVLVGCGESQQSAPQAEPVAEVPAQPSPPPVEAKPEPPTAKAPAVSIHDAAYDGNIEAVKQHLAAGTHVDAKDDAYGGQTTLHVAANRGHKEVVELLIANGADVNAKDKQEVNAKDEKGFTPLDYATIRKRTEIANLLRKHGGKTKKELEAAGK